MQASMLAPPAMLVLWSLVMLGWLAIVRFRAMANSRITILAPGGRGQDLDTVLPRAANWPAHNYTHLMEQPTLFYAICLILAVLGAQGEDILFAWAYVLLRVIHSLWQARVNTIPVRLALFGASTGCLLVLSVRAAILALRIA
jgi:hypothetical protein